MIDYETPDFIKNIQQTISESELYKSSDPNDPWQYGLENETHVTIAACLDNDVDLSELKKHLKSIDFYKLMITDVSVFKNKDFDVLKCSVSCDELFETNKEISNNFKLHTEFKTYHPHITIAYMKKGTAEKYMQNIIKEPVFIYPKNFSFSWFEGETPKSIKF